MRSSELENFSLVRLRDLVLKHEISSVDLVRLHFSRIATVNPDLNAVVTCVERRAFEEARRADRELNAGRPIGPLHGIPVTIKDSFDTEGVLSTAGTSGRRTFVPDTDATVVARLRAAGAIVLGKSNTPEITFSFETDNELFGATRNPYDLARTPGGSSGGAAAIIAAGGSPADIGSDTMGSIRQPAHYCGIAALKPTAGRVPRTGHIVSYAGPLEFLTQVGPMARYVEDLHPLLEIVAGPDGVDPWVVPVRLRKPSEVCLGELRCAFYTADGIAEPSAETVATVEAAASAVRSLVAAVVPARPSGLASSMALMMQLVSADSGAWARGILEEAGTRDSPMLDQPPRPQRMTAADYARLLAAWHEMRSEMLGFWRDHDVLVCPVSARPALPLGAAESALTDFSYTMPFSLSGWPGAVVRCGRSVSGLPIGVQIVAPPWREDIALAVAALLEKVLGGYSPPAERPVASGET